MSRHIGRLNSACRRVRSLPHTCSAPETSPSYPEGDRHIQENSEDQQTLCTQIATCGAQRASSSSSNISLLIVTENVGVGQLMIDLKCLPYYPQKR